MNTIKRSPIAAVLPLYTIGEEIVNSVLHGIGVLTATVGLIFLTLKNLGFLGGERTDSLNIIAVLIFGFTMIAMFLISTLYHAIQYQGAKTILRRMDHSVIFVFIAGTYTPYCLTALRGPWGWGFFAFEWALALTGIILNILDNKALKKVEVAVYIMMGWAIIIGFVPLVRTVPIISIVLLVVGGVAYTVGTIWYRMKNVRLSHAVWHSFVLLGAICHWFSIWFIF